MDKIQSMLADFHAKHDQGPADMTWEMWYRRVQWQLEELLT